MTTKLISLKEARERGLTRYFTGQPCKHGHVSSRLVSNRRCSLCLEAQSKKWQVENRAHYLESRKRSRIKNDTPQRRAQAVKRAAAWMQENKERYNEWRRDWQPKREEESPVFKVARRLRGRIASVVSKGWKSATTLELLGCSYECFLEHLKSQFTEGMTWDNYGEWHIDHIRPCKSFDLLDPEQQRQCFHYTNLQPLWAEDNIRKGSSYDI